MTTKSGRLRDGLRNVSTCVSVIPDSAIAHAVASDYDGSQWVADIGPDIPDAGSGSPTKTEITANSQSIDVVRYSRSDGGYSQTTNLSVSTGPQAIIYVVKNRSPDGLTSPNPYYIDDSTADSFTHLLDSRAPGDPHWIFSSAGANTTGDDVDSNLHVFCLEGDGSTMRLYRDGNVILSDNSGFNLLSGLTLAAKGDGTGISDLDIAEYTVLADYPAQDRDDEINRLINKYGI